MPQSLREQRSATTHAAILRAVVDLIGSTPLEAVTMPEVAERAGVSLRTLYRYYPDRDALASAVSAWIADNVIVAPLPATPGEVVEAMSAVAPRFEENVELVRALVRSRVGREIRSPRRQERIDAIREALRPALAHLDEAERDRVTAVVNHLSSAQAWLDVRDESGLDGEAAGVALSWAIETLLTETERRRQS